LLVLPALGRGQPQTDPPKEYAAAVESLDHFIAHEVADKRLPALSVALVDDQKVVWARGYGFANADRKKPASADTVYRVGSVSKLFRSEERRVGKKSKAGWGGEDAIKRTAKNRRVTIE